MALKQFRNNLKYTKFICYFIEIERISFTCKCLVNAVDIFCNQINLLPCDK